MAVRTSFPYSVKVVENVFIPLPEGTREDLMEESGGFIFICFEPFVAIHRSNLKPVILADGHPDPVQFKKF